MIWMSCSHGLMRYAKETWKVDILFSDPTDKRQEMKEIYLEKKLMGYQLKARCSILDEGIHVLLTGGSRTHVGAVSFCFPGETVQTVQFPGHRDGVVSKKWAEYLCRKFCTLVTVNCGIHYDNVCKEEICQIVAETEEMLTQIEAMVSQRI